MKSRRVFAAALALALAWPALAWLMLTAGASAAEPNYPNKPIRLVIGFPPGGTSDIVGRIVGNRLSELLGQSVVIDNRPGAAGLIGSQVVKQAPADGYTLLIVPSDFTLIPGLARTPPYDPAKDFTAIGLFCVYPHVLVANPEVQAKDAKELIALAKAKPGAINFASGGTGGSNHISGVAFESAAGIDITHVPYKGNGPALTDLLENRVQLLFTSMGPVEEFLKSGKLKALAVTGPRRLASLPAVATLSENALPGYEFTVWYGLIAPAGLPAPVVDRLNAVLREAMASAAVKDKLASIGGDLTVSTPGDFQELLAKETRRWRTLGVEKNIKID